MVVVTVLCENTVRRAGLVGEHGLAWWLEAPGGRVLFDTGQGLGLRRNAARLGIDLGRADAIVLSHGHYDHVLGLEEALAAAPGAALWMHPDAVRRRFTRDAGGGARRISTDFMEKAAFGAGRKVRWVTAPAEVAPGVWVTGEVPRRTAFEDSGGPFFLDEALRDPDPILDDMALYLPSGEGVSVVFGCAHAGVVNTLEHVFGVVGGRKAHTLVGGLHLAGAGEERMARTVEALRGARPEWLGFCHCTGLQAVARLWAEFPMRCAEVCVGTRVEMPGG